MFTGEFETHITIAPRFDSDIARLTTWATDHNVKFVHIELARGMAMSQPMVTYWGRGTLTDAREQAKCYEALLNEAGFTVNRVKIEASVHAEGIPQTDEAAQCLFPTLYFEHHLKLCLAQNTNLATIAKIAEAHGAHLSRNARRVRGDGLQERFVTQRCTGEGLQTAQERLHHLVEALQNAGFVSLEKEEEYVVFDSNLSLDSGWL